MTSKKEARVPEPFGSYVIVRPSDLIEMSKGGIAIARHDPARDRGAMTEGTVAAIGPLAFKDDLNPSGQEWYQVGDRVIFVKYGGKFITYDDELYIVFRYEDIICGIDPEATFSDGERE